MSDLHVEHETGRGPIRQSPEWLALAEIRGSTPGHPPAGPDLRAAKAADVKLVILAGDISVGAKATMAYARQVSEYLDGASIVLVPGNHEYYHGSIDAVDRELRDLSGLMPGSDVWALQRERLDVELAPGRPAIILGTTLWTDYAAFAKGAKHPDRAIERALIAAVGGLTDHAPGMIDIRGNRFHPAHARQMHDVSRQWLEREIARTRADNPGVPVIVVTHHPPVREASPAKFAGDPLTPAFVSDMRAEIEVWQPDLWVCGHTHHSFSLQIGRTTVMASQRGYVGSKEEGADSYVPAIVELQP